MKISKQDEKAINAAGEWQRRAWSLHDDLVLAVVMKRPGRSNWTGPLSNTELDGCVAAAFIAGARWHRRQPKAKKGKGRR